MINRATDLVEEGRYRSPFGYILVDESQDISPSRARLLKALLDSSPGSQLSAVGDDWQAIYRFGGSDIAVMREFGDHFGAFERIDLPTTFRCVDRIATVATIEQAPLLGVRMGLPPHVEHFGQSRAGQGQGAEAPPRATGDPRPACRAPRRVSRARLRRDSGRRASSGSWRCWRRRRERARRVRPISAPLEQGAQDVEGAVGRTRSLCARRVEPRRDPRRVDGVELEPSERGQQAAGWVSVGRITTRRCSPWRPCGGGGSGWARRRIHRRSGCRSPPTGAIRTAAAIGCGRWSCRSSPTPRGYAYRCVTFRRARASGTRSSIACSVTSTRTGVGGRW